MKRIWFAAAFLLISLTLCIGEQVFIGDFYKNMEQRTAEAISYCEAGDERFPESVEEVKSYWKRRNDLIFTLTNHGVLDDLSAHIRALDSESEPEDLKKVKATLEVFYENQRITSANIF